MFKTADNFGYSCTLPMIDVTNTQNPTDEPDTPNPTDKPTPDPDSSAAVTSLLQVAGSYAFSFNCQQPLKQYILYL